VRIEVDGTRLFFDVIGPALEPDGAVMRERPTILVIHGGPGSYDHSYLRPAFDALADVAQLVYLDLREHGRSHRSDPGTWTFEACADDIPRFCATLGIERPIVLGHSMGGFVGILAAARHPEQLGGLVLASTMARFDLDRLADGFRALGGPEIGELARRDYSGDEVSEADWARVYATFGPTVPTRQERARTIRNPEVGRHGMDLMRRFDVIDQLGQITVPTLVMVGALDPVTPLAAAEEIVAGLSPDIGRLAAIDGAGHFMWLDASERFFDLIRRFVTDVAVRPAVAA
jgi:proline iminopeptidase